MVYHEWIKISQYAMTWFTINISFSSILRLVLSIPSVHLNLTPKRHFSLFGKKCLLIFRRDVSIMVAMPDNLSLKCHICNMLLFWMRFRINQSVYENSLSFCEIMVCYPKDLSGLLQSWCSNNSSIVEGMHDWRFC